MNWTSTEVPLWQIDCEEFFKVGRVFELRDVKAFEHHQFVEVFAARHGLRATLKGTTVVFESAEMDRRSLHASMEERSSASKSFSV